MFNSVGRFGLMAILGISFGVCLFYNQLQLALLTIFLLGFVLWSHFKHGSILMASKYFKNNEFSKAKRFLAETKNPERLAKSRRGYYEFMKGNLALREEDFEEAEYHFQIASRFTVGGGNEKSYVLIHLANLALRKRDMVKASAYAEKAKELSVSSRSQELIKKIENEIKKIQN